MSKNKTDKILLSEDQQNFIRENWDKIPLLRLAQETFKNPDINGHYAEAKAIKLFIASFADEKDIAGKLKTSKFVAAGDIELTDDHKVFIRNNCLTMKPLECAKILFGDNSLTPLSREFRAISKYYEIADPTSIPKEDRIAEDVEYKPPTSLARIVPRINKYVMKNFGEGNKFLDPDNLKPQEKKNCQGLLEHMNVKKFIHQCNKYYKADDRELFESSFVNYCYDKPDLLPEEVGSYISVCAEEVTISKIEGIIESMERQLEEIISGTDSEGKRLSVSFVDAIKNQRDQLDKSKKHHKSLMSDLIGSRAKRQENKGAQQATIINLIEAVKSEEKRLELLKIAERQKMLEAEEVDKLSDMDSVVALIAGLSKERAKYG